jgi:hypothetical protein
MRWLLPVPTGPQTITDSLARRVFDLDEAASGQVTDLLGRYLGVEVEIEIFESLLLFEMGLGNAIG